MGRPRVSNLHYPKRMQFQHGKFYYIVKGEWLPLGADEAEATAAANRYNELSRASRLAAMAAVRSVCAEVRDMVMIRDKYRCVYCGATEGLEIDHVIPASKGGASTTRNLVTACTACNCTKSDGDLAEFFVKLHRVVERCMKREV